MTNTPHQTMIHQFESVLALVKKECAERPDYAPKSSVLAALESARGLINVGEEGIAFENLTDNLFEHEFPLSDQLYGEIEKLGKLIGMEAETWTYLSQMVAGVE
jgi:hypothetical protein